MYKLVLRLDVFSLCMFLLFPHRLMVTGYKRPLEEKDLWSLNTEDKSQRVVPQLVRRWDQECNKVKRSEARGHFFFFSSRQLATKMTNPLIGLCFCVRPVDKTLYSPKRAARGEKKDGQPIEESEILLAKTLQKTGEPSLFCALCRTFGPYFLVSSLYKIIHDILMFVGPEILRYEYTASESSISFFHVGSFPSVLSSEAGKVQVCPLPFHSHVVRNYFNSVERPLCQNNSCGS